MDDNQLLRNIADSVGRLDDKLDAVQDKLSDYQVAMESRLTKAEVRLNGVCDTVARLKPTAFKSGSNGTSQAVTLNLSKSLVIVLAIVLLLLGGAGKEILGFIFGGG